jgi:Dyp-type peroxidase family
MPVRLDRPLSKLRNADEAVMLSQLQGNILKGHGRNRTAHVFLRIKTGKAALARAFLRQYAADKLMSAAQQLEAAAIFKREGPDCTNPLVNRAFTTIVISATGYKALGLAPEQTPTDASFLEGLKTRGAQFNDPPKNKWHQGYRGQLHVMILIGGKADSEASDISSMIELELIDLVARAPKKAITFVGLERGRAYENAHGKGVEHFGYVDGRSQPLLLEEDVEKEDADPTGAFIWNPAFPLSQVLVKDPAVADPNVFGSYFVFRKLEQNVKGFKTAEDALQAKLETLAASAGKVFPAELAGAMLVGRFEDGTPVSLQDHDGLSSPVINNFDFADDMQGLKCPFHAHIRKTNPRGDTFRLFGAPQNGFGGERSRIMARRGIAYGKRKQVAGQFTDKPSARVGLLFMAYQGNIAEQFEFTQAQWANNQGFVKINAGADPVIGQGGTIGQTHRAGWNDATAPTQQQFFGDFVTLKGGEYFFAPSLGFFAGL